MKTLRLFFYLFLLSSAAYAQPDNKMFKSPIYFSWQERQKKLYFSFENLSFLKNNEYFNPIADGYTLFGYQLNPKLAYYPNQYAKLEAGVYLLEYFGKENFRTIAPTFSLHLNKDNFHFIFGNLHSSLNHRMVEPLYDFERRIVDPLEYGLQFIINKRRFYSDAWIDWEKAIYKNDPFREEFVVGNVTEFIFPIYKKVDIGGESSPPPKQAKTWQNLLKDTTNSQDYPDTIINKKDTAVRKKLVQKEVRSCLRRSSIGNIINLPIGHLKFPIQTLIAHKGGQIDASADPVQSLLNVAAGVDFTYNFYDFIKSVSTKNYFVYYKDISPTSTVPFEEGHGIYLNAAAASKHGVELMFSYWKGNKFIGPRGGALYQSVSEKTAGFTEPDRELLLARLLYEKMLFDDLYLGIRFEPYYDFNNELLEYSYGLYITYNIDFLLKDFNK